MKRLLVVLFAAALLAPGALAQAEPFVADGEIQVTLVADTPQDIVLASQVAAYLQQYADQTRTGLAQTPAETDLDNGTYLLVGAPEDNAAVNQALAGRELSGATLAFVGDDYLISGRTGMQVEHAAQLFMQGERSHGELLGEAAEAVEDAEQFVNETRNETQNETQNFTIDDDYIPDVQPSDPAPPINQTCDPATYCDENTLVQRTSDCGEQRVEYCGNGCVDGACQQGFFVRLWTFISFWN